MVLCAPCLCASWLIRMGLGRQVLLCSCSKAEGRCHWIVYCESQSQVTHLCFLNIYLLKKEKKELAFKSTHIHLVIERRAMILLRSNCSFFPRNFSSLLIVGCSNGGQIWQPSGSQMVFLHRHSVFKNLYSGVFWHYLHVLLLLGVHLHGQMLAGASPQGTEFSDTCSREGKETVESPGLMGRSGLPGLCLP